MGVVFRTSPGQAEPLAPRHRDGHPGTKPFSTASTEAGSTVVPREGSTAFPTRDAFPRHAPTLRKGSPASELAPVCRIPVLFALAFTIARRRSPSGTWALDSRRQAPPDEFCSLSRPADTSASCRPRTREGCRAERAPEDSLRPGAPARGSTTRVASPSPTASEHPLSPDGADAGWESERRPTRLVQAPLPDAHREAGRRSTKPGAFHQQPSRALSLSHRARPALPRFDRVRRRLFDRLSADALTGSRLEPARPLRWWGGPPRSTGTDRSTELASATSEAHGLTYRDLPRVCMP